MLRLLCDKETRIEIIVIKFYQHKIQCRTFVKKIMNFRIMGKEYLSYFDTNRF
jgi:hypothetical protein